MAVLTRDQKLGFLRDVMRGGTITATWKKAAGMALVQAVEDWFDRPAVRASLKADMDATGFVVSNAVAKKIAKFVLLAKLGDE